MKTSIKIIVTIFCFVMTTSCNSENPSVESVESEIIPPPTPPPSPLELPTQSKTINYLALGDSYTIGQSVCESCRFPEQLKKSLKNLNQENNFSAEIIARTRLDNH